MTPGRKVWLVIGYGWWIQNKTKKRWRVLFCQNYSFVDFLTYTWFRSCSRVWYWATSQTGTIVADTYCTMAKFISSSYQFTGGYIEPRGAIHVWWGASCSRFKYVQFTKHCFSWKEKQMLDISSILNLSEGSMTGILDGLASFINWPVCQLIFYFWVLFVLESQ